MNIYPNLAQLHTTSGKSTAEHQVYMVHISHTRDARQGITPRPAEPNNQVGPYGDDPVQYGELYMHVWLAHDGCMANAPPLTKEELCLGDDRRFREDWIGALVNGMPWDDEAGDEDTAFLFDKKYCVHWTDAAAHPWQGTNSSLKPRISRPFYAHLQTLEPFHATFAQRKRGRGGANTNLATLVRRLSNAIVRVLVCFADFCVFL